MFITDCGCDTTPVSYTHLDVYKRQGYTEGVFTNHLDVYGTFPGQSLEDCLGTSPHVHKS